MRRCTLRCGPVMRRVRTSDVFTRDDPLANSPQRIVRSFTTLLSPRLELVNKLPHRNVSESGGLLSAYAFIFPVCL